MVPERGALLIAHLIENFTQQLRIGRGTVSDRVHSAGWGGHRSSRESVRGLFGGGIHIGIDGGSDSGSDGGGWVCVESATTTGACSIWRVLSLVLVGFSDWVAALGAF